MRLWSYRRHPMLEANLMADPTKRLSIEGDPELQSRDPEDRPVRTERELKEKTLDKTDADSFPASDPPSSIPDPSEEDSFAS